MRKQRRFLFPQGLLTGIETGKNAESLRFLLGRFDQVQKSMKHIITLLLAPACFADESWETTAQEESYEKTVQALQEKAENGDVKAQLWIGTRYYEGVYGKIKN